MLVQWPESQMFMEHVRFDECALANDESDDMAPAAYFVPEDLYREMFDIDADDVGSAT